MGRSQGFRTPRMKVLFFLVAFMISFSMAKVYLVETGDNNTTNIQSTNGHFPSPPRGRSSGLSFGSDSRELGEYTCGSGKSEKVVKITPHTHHYFQTNKENRYGKYVDCSVLYKRRKGCNKLWLRCTKLQLKRKDCVTISRRSKLRKYTIVKKLCGHWNIKKFNTKGYTTSSKSVKLQFKTKRCPRPIYKMLERDEDHCNKGVGKMAKCVMACKDP